jgi:hypothetical protein
LADGLRAAWRKGLLHRDIKPANVLFADPQTVKIADFGLAQAIGDSQNADPNCWGSPHYVSPERASSQAEDIRSDIYSLGCTLYHALAGRAPFEGEDPQAVTRKRINASAPNVRTFAPHVTESTAAVLAEALQREPGDRFQDYDELIDALEISRHALANRASRGTTQVQAQPQPKLVAKAPPKKRSKLGLVAAIVTLVAGGAGAAAWFQGWIPHSIPGFAGNSAAPGREEAGFGSFAAPYSAARTQMLQGDFANAALAFQRIAGDPKTPPTARDWSRFDQGLASLLAGELPKATAAFQEFDPDPKQSRDVTRAFLSQVARQCANGSEAPKLLAAGVDKDSAQALGLLAYGLIDWNLRDYDDAESLLRQFSSAHIEAAWIKECQLLANPYLKELAATALLETFDRSAPRSAQLDKIKALREALGDFRPNSPLLPKFQKTLNEYAGGAGLNTTTPWGAPATIAINFAEPTKVSRWVIRNLLFGHKEVEVEIKLEASDDGESWHDVDAYSGPPKKIDRKVDGFTARGIRVSLKEPSKKGDPDHRISGFELYGENGLVTDTPPLDQDLARKKPVEDQGGSVDVHLPSCLVDGDPTAHWEAVVTPCWIVVDLEKTKTINRWVAVHSAATTTPTHARPSSWNTASYKLQASDDQKDWRDIDTVTDNLCDVTDRRVPEFSARYIRFYGLKSSINGDYKTRVAELLIYGPDDSGK